MKHLRHVSLMVVLLLGVVLSQEQDVVLQSYGLASEHLNTVLTSLTEDPVASRDALASALQTVRPLSRDTVSVSLVPSIEATFARARTAIDNQSDTDLIVQVTVLRGGLQRMVYESALRAVNTSEPEAARARLLRVAADQGMATEILDALAAAEVSTLFPTFEQGVAQVAAGHLALANQAEDVPATYRNLAASYSALIPVQDSPRVPPALLTTFISSFQALVQGETAEFEQLDSLLDAFAENALSGAPAASEPAPTITVSESEGTEATAPAADIEAVTVPNVPALAAPQESNGMSEITTVPAPSALDLEREAQREALSQRFAELGLNTALSTTLVETYLDNNYLSTDDVVAVLQAAGSEMVVATTTTDLVRFETALSRYRSVYGTFLSPLVNRQAPDLAQNTSRTLLALESSPDVRLQDVTALLGQTRTMAGVLVNRPEPLLNRIFLETTLIWGGWLRSVVMLILAIFAFIPLRLLNLAFGGGNRNWRLIGVALFLLLLPVIYEGLSSLGAVLADLTGIRELAILAAFSIFQNNVSQVIWSLLIAAAIGLATTGLYGICVQFGLLGKKTMAVDATAVRNPTMPVESADDVVEWDEEF
jgi:hypothetical protein